MAPNTSDKGAHLRKRRKGVNYAEPQTDESSDAGAEESQDSDANEVDNAEAEESTNTRKRKTASVGKQKTAAKSTAPSAQRRIANQPRRWTDEEMCQLLANLEWSVRNETDFWSSGLPNFQGAVDRDISRSQTYGKLTTILRKYGPEESAATNVPRELIAAGLEILTLPEEISTRVNEIIESFHEVRSVKLRVPSDGLRRIFQEEDPGDQDSSETPIPAQNDTQADNSSQASPSPPPDDGQSPDNDQSPDNNPSSNDEQSATNEPIRSADEQYTEDTPEYYRSKVLELETRLLKAENEIARVEMEKKYLENYTPDARAKYILQQQVVGASMRVMRNRTFNVNDPGMEVGEISRSYKVVSNFIRYFCRAACRRTRETLDPSLCSELARSWACQNFGNAFDIKDYVPQMGESFYKEDLLAAVISSAIIQRVFEPSFPTFLQTANPVADSYREIICNEHGVEELHRADYNALTQLVADQGEDMIERRAKELDSLFLKHLKFFWDPSTRYPEEGHEGTDELSKTPLSFRIVLQKALDLKLSLTTSTTRLKFFYYPPDEPFDESRMQRCMGSDRERDRIKFCLIPTLLFPPARETSTSSDEYALEHNIHYSMYFTELREGNPSDLELAAPAMVLT